MVNQKHNIVNEEQANMKPGNVEIPMIITPPETTNPTIFKGCDSFAILSLARVQAYAPICFFCTIVGLNVAECPPDLTSLFLIGLANTFAFIATFTFNNIEDVIEDIKSKSLKNAIALGKVSKKFGYMVSILATITSITLSFFAGYRVLFILIAILVIGFLYSWRPVRLKTKPFWDVFSNGVVGSLMFLSSAWSSKERGVFFDDQLIPVCMLFTLGTALSLIVHQLYDYSADFGNITTSVLTIGKKNTYRVIGVILFLMGCLLTYECWKGTFPLSSILAYCIVSGSIIAVSLIFLSRQSTFLSKCLVPWAINSGAIAAILVWYFYPAQLPLK